MNTNKRAYNLLAGRVHGLDYDHNPRGGKHMQIYVRQNQTPHRIALNVHSANPPDEVLFRMVDPFVHPITGPLSEIDDGYYDLLSPAFDSVRLDYIDGGFGLSKDIMEPIPFIGPSDSDTLKRIVEPLVMSASRDRKSWRVFAFGEPWGPEHNRRDRYFDFLPGRGIHDIHMNQGGTGRYVDDNRVRQDGALMMQHADGRWIALFIAFQTQIWRNP